MLRLLNGVESLHYVIITTDNVVQQLNPVLVEARRLKCVEEESNNISRPCDVPKRCRTYTSLAVLDTQNMCYSQQYMLSGRLQIE